MGFKIDVVFSYYLDKKSRKFFPRFFYPNRSVSEVWHIIKGVFAFIYHHGKTVHITA